MGNSSWLLDRRVWAAGGISLLLLVALIFWAVRAHQRADARDLINAYEPFLSPPVDLSFPASVPDQPPTRELLEPGRREGHWALRERGGTPPSLQVRLTNDGYRSFSAVGNQIVATFHAGRRTVSRVVSISGDFPSRQVHFEYTWNSLHPSVRILGDAAPRLGATYEGEALLYYENDAWKILHWSTPDLDDPIERLRSLLPPR